MMILRLKRDTLVFDLTAGGFSYGTDFAPPATAYADTYTTGTALHTGGGSLLLHQPVMRDWTFSLRVEGASQSAIETSIRRLEEFLAAGSYAGGPTYIEYSPLSIPEPCCGWFGAVRRYEIISAETPVISAWYGEEPVRQQALMVTLTLHIKPYASGPARRVGEATGTITEPVGADGLATGVTVAASSRIRIPVAVGQAEQATIAMAGGAALVVWKTATASTATGNKFLFSCGNSSLRAYFNASDDKFYLTDNSNSASSSAATFAAGDTIRLLFTWGATNKLKVYRDGVQIASAAAYSAPSAPTYVYLGSDASAANQALGTLTLTIWPSEPTAAQVAAIDAEAAAVLSAGGRVDHTVWLSSPAGDSILDPYNDSDQTNYATVGGIPGSGTAMYRAMLSLDGISQGGTAIIGLAADPYADGLTAPGTWWVEKGSTSESGNSAGNYGTSVDSTISPGKRIDAQACAAVFRARASSGTNTLAARMSVGKNETDYLGLSATFSIPDNYDLYLLPHVYVPPKRVFARDTGEEFAVVTVSGSVNRVDYVLFLPSPEVLQFDYGFPGPANGVPVGFFDDRGAIPIKYGTAAGASPKLLPGHYNTFLHAGDFQHLLALETLAPRWGLL